MTSAYRIRDAVPADAGIMVRMLMSLASETENVELDEGEVRRGVTTLFEQGSLGRLYVAEEVPKGDTNIKGPSDGNRSSPQIVGVMTVTYEWSDWRGKLFLWIQSVYIIPSKRKQGIFQKFYDHLIRIMAEDPKYCGLRLAVNSKNEKAIRAYKQVGMKREKYQLMGRMKSKY
ncbi:acetyltransferase, putative [Trypanosoma brucei gambiense DAL972]|uniref:Acetyltransferase, putative n=2 Tax=Trypanosoma brucei TaxID=5691 RepID=C9ZI21_TRYB9|nr:acetyltransferase, putative [Trypanosoma brucei gambiense DAL972]RHW74354.1 acetyltransferase [Trypanosoma brucei equiperdum]CBH09138.1 acetyltransferase, putative [Trypanosoma brucei gambiense DAL972]|eukprot:XP_011771579.1 acetyltransferase, putative [Trypanosoma brucei gambiense DAL972]